MRGGSRMVLRSGSRQDFRMCKSLLAGEKGTEILGEFRYGFGEFRYSLGEFGYGDG